MAEPTKYISQQDLRKHNNRGDLWISIHGKIYDVTHWIHDHPGGEHPLLNLAGQDVTNAFLAFHPGSAWHHLDKFFTGYHLQDYIISEVSKDYRKLVFEFSKMGLFEKKGHGLFFSLLSMAIMFCVCVYGVLCCDSPWVHVGSGGLMGFLWIQSSWIAHDSAHYQVMTRRGFNRFVQILTGNCLSGIGIAWWKWIHNAHHIACNNLEFDPDIQLMPLFVVSSKFFNSLTSHFYERKMNFDSVSRFLVSYQHWTFYPVMLCFARLNLLAQPFILLLSKRKVPYRCQELLGLLVFWIWYTLLVSCLHDWFERILFVIASFAVAGIQHVQFSLNHFSTSVYVGEPNANDWFEKQTSGTLDIKCSAWMDWFHGGLQFQVAHHLFPRMPRCHLRRITPLVRELCKTHNLPYMCASSFWEANALTFRTLREAALQARVLSNPVPKNLVWEAVKTYG